MGYTHYFERNNLNKGSAYMFGKLALDAKQIIQTAKEAGIEICGPHGHGEPEFTEGHFSFNGLEMLGQDHETFYWEALPVQPEWQTQYFRETGRDQNVIFDFCKTAYKPYDAVVTAVLIRAKEIYGSLVDIRSDGNWEDWQAGRDLYEATFGTAPQCPWETANV